MKKIAVIGGGISGLTAAYLLRQKDLDVTVFEASDRVGGNIKTETKDGFLLELGPNSLLRSPRLIDLIRQLNIESEVVAAQPQAKKRYVFYDGKLQPLPTSLLSFIFGDFFSLNTKLKILTEPFRRNDPTEDESVADFFKRRFSSEIVEKAADPFISGIYAGDPSRLSMSSAFPRFSLLERKYGSLINGMLKDNSEKSDKNFPRTFSFTNGVETLTKALADSLGDNIKTNSRVIDLRFKENKYEITVGDEVLLFDEVIIAVTANAAANILKDIDPDANIFNEIKYPPVTMVHLGYAQNAVERDLDGFGFLISGRENRKILGAVWNSSVFTERAPKGYHLVTAFVGGARQPELAMADDENLINNVTTELKDIIGANSKPIMTNIVRYPRAIPQYQIGYKKIEDHIIDLEQRINGLHFCTNFYKGISVGDCIKNAYFVADQIGK